MHVGFTSRKTYVNRWLDVSSWCAFLLGPARELKHSRTAGGAHPKSPWWEDRGRRRRQLCNEVAKQQQVREGEKRETLDPKCPERFLSVTDDTWIMGGSDE